MGSFETVTSNDRHMLPAIEMDALGLTLEDIQALGGDEPVTPCGMVAFRQGLYDRSALEAKPDDAIDREITEEDFAAYQMGYMAQELLLKRQEGGKT